MYSTTQAGNIAAFIGVAVILLRHFNVDITEEELQTLAGAVLSFVGIITSWIGRYRKGDLSLSGFRK